MTVAEFLHRLQQPPYRVTITPYPDGSRQIDVDHGYRAGEWAYFPVLRDEDTLDDEVARSICRRLGIPTDHVGL